MATYHGGRPGHGQLPEDLLSAESGQFYTGSAMVEPDPGLDSPEDIDLNSFVLPELRTNDPRTTQQLPIFPSFSSSHQGGLVSSSSTQSAFQLSSQSNSSGFHHEASQSQSSGAISRPKQRAPWHPLDVAGPPQRSIPYHTKEAERAPAFRASARPLGTASDSGYRTGLQHDTPSLLSTGTHMDRFHSDVMDSQSDYAAYHPGDYELDDTHSFDNILEHTQTHQQYEPDAHPSFVEQEYNLNDQEAHESASNEHGQRHDLDCPVCGEVSKTPSDAKKHLARHQKPFRCTDASCGRHNEGFATANDLNRHIKSVHKAEVKGSRSFKCFAEACSHPEKIWPRKDNFTQHLQRMHRDEDQNALLAKSEEWYDQLNPVDDKAEETIVNEVRRQEDSVRQQNQQQKRASGTATGSKRKRNAPEQPTPAPQSQRTRHSLPGLDTASSHNSMPPQDMRLLSPYSPTPDRPVVDPRQHVSGPRQRRAQNSHRQAQPQPQGPSMMSRSVSQAGQYMPRTPFHGMQQQPYWSFDPQQTHAQHFSPQDVRSQFEPRWHPQQQMPQPHLGPTDRHTVAGDIDTRGYEWLSSPQDHPLQYGGFTNASMPIPAASELVGHMQPAAPASVSPTTTGMNPETPTSSTPVLRLTVDDSSRPPVDTLEISNFLENHDDFKKDYNNLRQAVIGFPAAQHEFLKILRAVGGSSNAAAPPSEESRSQAQSKRGHHRQPSITTTTTSTTAVSTNATQGALDRAAAGREVALCSVCNKLFARGSDLKKHMKRHDRPYGCVSDGCSKSFGSKSDWKRHEATHGEVEGGWRCDGRHLNPLQNNEECHMWWPQRDVSQEQYCNHLQACAVPLEDIQPMSERCFIPRANTEAYWCGFCYSVMRYVDPDLEPAKERVNHIERHYKNEARINDHWRDCNGGGRTKLEMGQVIAAT